MKYLLIMGYIAATIAIMVGEYKAILKGHDSLTHLVLLGLLVWNSLVMYGFLRRTTWSFKMIKIVSYLQLFFVLAGLLAYVTDLGYSMNYNDQDVTLLGSLAFILWAVIKLVGANKHYQTLNKKSHPTHTARLL